MPRQPRMSFEDAFLHVFNRGINKSVIFNDSSDYLYFLNKLKKLKSEHGFDHRIFSYVLMPNHFHLLIQVNRVSISRIMSSLTTSYSMYFNRKNNRFGPLFQNRFKSIICEKDRYLLALSRYIHLNPVKAKLAADPFDYQWSSINELFGFNNRGLMHDEDKKLFIGSTKEEKDNYRKFLSDKKEEEVSDNILEEDVVGSPIFISLTRKKYIRKTKKSQDIVTVR